LTKPLFCAIIHTFTNLIILRLSMKKSLLIPLAVLVILIVASAVFFLNQTEVVPQEDVGTQAAEEVDEPLDCAVLEGEWLAHEGDDLSFCYLADWGEVNVSDVREGQKGQSFNVSFSNTTENDPSMYFETSDYFLGGDMGGHITIDWDYVDPALEYAELANIIPLNFREMFNYEVGYEVVTHNDIAYIEYGSEHDVFFPTEEGERVSEVYFLLNNVEIDSVEYGLLLSGTNETWSNMKNLLNTLTF
jgi:hypothetical protein